ncbi:hypothetical protein NC652_004505 [Populus alba x Populus x berolinensis]|uniref:Uncharacterized protein n=3 Tax=Populus TaxID=3689 RepID=A0ACC4AFN6_POPAL|nr:uncharacterized protein LOC118046731 [Populus alba]KAG6794133.1 hypothetical protein POTOM_003368 [Populus tomentosa]KAJ6966961.1 hypothetical protein NC652_004505 [Populus alba x Populus x berolinensis]TKR60100.1 hypothetical protein D5086_0000324110 [Populus alba]
MASDGNKNKPLDREVRDMVNTMTRRIVDQFHKPSASLHNQESAADEDGHGVRIVTLAGTNTGASMRSELDDQKSNKLPDGVSFGDPEASGTYVNSNFQALNNSIMFGSNYSTNDPGVHMDISDTYDEHRGLRPDKHGKKGKKEDEDEEASKSDQHSEHSD